MNNSLLQYYRTILQFLKPQENLSVWQWHERYTDFSKVPNYDSPCKGKYSANLMPWFKEIQECVTDPNVREIVLLKNTRAGGSENLLLNSIVYSVACNPMPILYLSTDQSTSERFLEKRVKRRLKMATATKRALNAATCTQHDITFPNCDFHVAWPKSRSAFKSDGYALVLADEVSTYPSFSADMLRSRVAAYPFPHIIYISSLCPTRTGATDTDPIFMLWERGDKREWVMKDPAGNGNEFRFEMGTKDGAGLHWSSDAKREDETWDLEKVRKTAHYVTPSGAIIEEKDRLKILKTGHWSPTATDTAAPKTRSYRMNMFLSPFELGTFGNIAVEFLKAKENGSNALKTFVYEYLAEPFYQQKQATNDDTLFERCENYMVGESGKTILQQDKKGTVFLTVDVQKNHFWWVCREWWSNGDSALIDYGYAVTFEDLENIANQYGVTRVGIDCGYAERAVEVYEYAEQYKALPLRGSLQLKLPVAENIINPREGKRGQNDSKSRILTYTFNADIFKSILFDMMSGASRKKWIIPKNVNMEYIRQAGSEEKVDGLWICKKGRPENHIADCETMSVVMAYLHNLLPMI